MTADHKALAVRNIEFVSLPFGFFELELSLSLFFFFNSQQRPYTPLCVFFCRLSVFVLIFNGVGGRGERVECL